MPIRPENRDRYPKDWPLISSYIRRVRALSRCEWCGVRDGATGVRNVECGEIFIEMPPDGWIILPAKGDWRPTKIVLTVAHVFVMAPEEVSRDNLAALCQRCHLLHDMKYHRARRRETLRNRKGLTELFAEHNVERPSSYYWGSD